VIEWNVEHLQYCFSWAWKKIDIYNGNK